MKGCRLTHWDVGVLVLGAVGFHKINGTIGLVAWVVAWMILCKLDDVRHNRQTRRKSIEVPQ